MRPLQAHLRRGRAQGRLVDELRSLPGVPDDAAAQRRALVAAPAARSRVRVPVSARTRPRGQRSVHVPGRPRSERRPARGRTGRRPGARRRRRRRSARSATAAGAGGTSTSKTPVPSRKVALNAAGGRRTRPTPRRRRSGARRCRRTAVGAGEPPAEPEARALEAGPALEVRGALEVEVGDEHVAVHDAEVDGARQLEVGADGRGRGAPARGRRGRSRAAQARGLDADDPVADGEVHGGASERGGALPKRASPGPKASRPPRSAGPRLRQAALERRQVEVERHALVVHPQLAALDEQAADAHLGRAAAPAEAQRGMSSPALGKGAHADPRADHAQLVEVEPALPQRAQRGRGHDQRDLEEGRIRRVADRPRAGRAPRPGTGTARSAPSRR